MKNLFIFCAMLMAMYVGTACGSKVESVEDPIIEEVDSVAVDTTAVDTVAVDSVF